jgi:hypothetical protein
MIRVNLNLNAREHIRIALCLAGFSMAGWAQAQSIELGKAAPPSVAAQLKGTPAVVIGSVSVKPLRQAPSTSSNDAMRHPLEAAPQGNTTYVVRTRDNLVGISTNDLVVKHPDAAAVVAAAGASVASAKPYPDLGLVILHVASFDQLVPLHRVIADRFPTAKFDLPVTYFPVRPR